MTSLRQAFAAAAAAFGVFAAATPVFAQGWYDDGYRRPWPHYPGRYYESRPYWGYDAGVTDIAICPPGYHLGRSGRLCWPD